MEKKNEAVNKEQSSTSTNSPVAVQKTNIWMILFFILLTAMVAGGGVYYYLTQFKKEGVQETPPQGSQTEVGQPAASVIAQPSQVTLTQPTLTSIDDIWNQYTNPALGFSLKVLKNMMEYYGQCYYNDKNGDHSYRPQEAAVPVKIFEEGNMVYIAAEYIYKLTGETKQNSRSYFSGCNKTPNTAETVKDMKNYYSPAWRIQINKVSNDNELEQFLKTRYGEGCSLGAQKPTKQTGVFDIEIKGDGKDLGETKCPLNYMTVVKYYPAKQKVAAWDIGQACNFYYPTIDTCRDQEMTDSFTFE
jgi:hypothetical protein